MKILALDVTGNNLVVALYDGKEIFSEIPQAQGKRHNSLVMPAIETILNRANLTIKDIDVFACVVGPGSFTGIRIGIATIKALSFATQKPCVAINSLEELAYGKEGHFYTLIDALHDNFYAAKFNGSWEAVEEIYCKHIDDIKKDNIQLYFKEEDSKPENLIAIAKKKAEKKEFSTLEPIYLRKSQAERDRDGD